MATACSSEFCCQYASEREQSETAFPVYWSLNEMFIIETSYKIPAETAGILCVYCQMGSANFLSWYRATPVLLILRK